MNSCNLNLLEQNILNEQLLKYYCNENNIEINYKITPEFYNNDNQNTVALWISNQQLIPPKCWYHNPRIFNKNGDTVATSLLNHSIIPPREWCYDPDISFMGNESIYDEFILNKLPFPRYLINMSGNINKFIEKLRSDNVPIPSEQQEINPTIFDVAMAGQIPQLNNHKSNEQNQDGWTVAMILAYQNIEIPKQWNHNPFILNKFGHTVEDHLISNNRDVPKQWKTYPQKTLSQQEKEYIQKYCNHYNIKLNYNISSMFNFNYHQNTIAMYLADKGIIPPKVFMHDVNKKNRDGKSIKSLLLQNQYIQNGNKFIPNFKTHPLDEICQICFTQGKQQFIKTTCKHKICQSCFKQLLEEHNISSCPICKQKYWFEQIEKVDIISDNYYSDDSSNEEIIDISSE